VVLVSELLRASSSAEQFPGRTEIAKPLDGTTASSRAKQNQLGGTGKGLSAEKKALQKISPNVSSSSVAPVKASERAVSAGKPPITGSRTPVTGYAKSGVEAKNPNPPAVKPRLPTSKPEPVSTDPPLSAPSSSAPDAKSLVRYAYQVSRYVY
jgi:hypothetical protein